MRLAVLWVKFVGKGRSREKRNLPIVDDFSVVSGPLTSGPSPEDSETRGFSEDCSPSYPKEDLPSFVFMLCHNWALLIMRNPLGTTVGCVDQRLHISLQNLPYSFLPS